MREDKDVVKIREKAEMLLLSVRVQPGAASDQIVGSYNGALKIRLVPRSINTVTFVASATASSSRSDDDAMSVTSWRRRDKEIAAVPPPPFGLMEVAGDLCVARRRRCPCIASSSLLDLPLQAPSANIIVFMERDT